MYIKTPVSPVASLSLPHASSCSCLVPVLVSARGPALVSFVLLAPLVGYSVPRMKVIVPAYDQPIVL